MAQQESARCFYRLGCRFESYRERHTITQRHIMTEQELYFLVSDFDEEDIKYIILEDEEIQEIKFRWEYQHESITETDSPFKRIVSDY